MLTTSVLSAITCCRPTVRLCFSATAILVRSYRAICIKLKDFSDANAVKGHNGGIQKLRRVKPLHRCMPHAFLVTSSPLLFHFISFLCRITRAQAFVSCSRWHLPTPSAAAAKRIMAHTNELRAIHIKSAHPTSAAWPASTVHHYNSTLTLSSNISSDNYNNTKGTSMAHFQILTLLMPQSAWWLGLLLL